MRKSYKQINDGLKKAMSLITVSKCITPINDASEQKTFFKNYSRGIRYNPRYEYEDIPKSIKDAKASLLVLKKDARDKMQIDLINKLLLLIEFLENVRVNKKQVYPNGKINPKIVAIAKLTFPIIKKRKIEKKLLAVDAKNAFNNQLRCYGITGWKVIIKKDLMAKSYVDANNKKIFIKDKFYSFSEISNLISHEIDVHVLRAVNGKNTKNTLFFLGTAEYLKTEEGLAIMMEQLTGNNDPYRFKFFCARVVACELALTKSFYDVFEILYKTYKFSKIDAYNITKRVKRGLTDTSNHGGYIKDHVYFEGYHLIKKFMQDGGDIRPLFIGKISLHDLQFLKKEYLHTEKIIIPKALNAHYANSSKQKVLY